MTLSEKAIEIAAKAIHEKVLDAYALEYHIADKSSCLYMELLKIEKSILNENL